MRNFLMAATAIAGVAVAVTGTAQAQMPNQPVVSTSFGKSGNGGDFPAPGTVTVNLAARVVVEGGFGSDSASIGKSGISSPDGTHQLGNGFKQQPYFLGTSVRIYPSADGVAANGLKYGGAIEIRQNSGGTKGASSSTLYIRQGQLYIGGTWGKVLVGPTDGGLTSTMNVGALEAFDWTGGLNGSTQFLNGAAENNWAFWENSNTTQYNKVVYLSPAFAGFKAGVSFEPSTSVGDSGAGPAMYSSAPNSNGGQRRNTVEVGANYTAALGPVAISVSGGYVGSGVVSNSTNLTGVNKYKGISIYDGGVNVTFAGFTVGGHATGGDMNSDNSLLRTGQKKTESFLIGANYQIGTVIFGGHYLNQLSAGGYNPARVNGTLHEIGGAVGAAVDWAPGSTAYVSAAYIQRRQAQYDLINGAPGLYNDSTVGRYLMVGNVFKW